VAAQLLVWQAVLQSRFEIQREAVPFFWGAATARRTSLWRCARLHRSFAAAAAERSVVNRIADRNTNAILFARQRQVCAEGAPCVRRGSNKL